MSHTRSLSNDQQRNKRSAPAGFRHFTEFRSHEGEFDYLKSLEIEEKINQIKWCRRSTDALLMLTTNGICPFCYLFFFIVQARALIYI